MARFDLEAAVAAASAGDVIEIPAGRYKLASTLNIKKPLALRGCAEETIITGHGEDGSFEVAVRGDVTISEVTFKRGTGGVSVVRGHVILTDCFFENMKLREFVAPGVVASKTGVVTATRCVAARCDIGFLALDRGRLTLRECTARDSQFSGVDLRSKTTSANVDGCTLADNALFGMAVWERASARLTNSIIECNREQGVFWCADGVIENNTCSDNHIHGIYLFGASKASVRGNEVRNNTVNGVVVDGKAKPRLESNHIHNNDNNGLQIEEASTPFVVGNRFEENGENGIVVCDKAKPIVRDNLCSGNEHNGIVISDSSRATIVGNQVSASGTDGISVVDSGYASVDGNVCRDNSRRGIYVEWGARAKLGDNELRDNGVEGRVDVAALCRRYDARRKSPLIRMLEYWLTLRIVIEGFRFIDDGEVSDEFQVFAKDGKGRRIALLLRDAPKVPPVVRLNRKGRAEILAKSLTKYLRMLASPKHWDDVADNDDFIAFARFVNDGLKG